MGDREAMMFVEVEAGSSERAVSRWSFALPLVPITLSVFCLSALVYYQVHRGGIDAPNGVLQGLVVGLHGLIGFVPAFLFCLLVLAWSSIWFFTGKLEQPGARLGRLGALVLSLAILVNLGEGAVALVPPGGAIGEYLAVRFESVFGAGLSTLLVSIAAIAALLLATDYFFYRYFEPLGRSGIATDLREEIGTEAEAAEVLGSLPVADVRAAAPASRRAQEPVDIVTGEEDPAEFDGPSTGVATESDAADAEEDTPRRRRRRSRRHLRIDDDVPGATTNGAAIADDDDDAATLEVPAESAEDAEDVEIWEDEVGDEPATATAGGADDWEVAELSADADDDDEEDVVAGEEAEDEEDWEAADYEDEEVGLDDDEEVEDEEELEDDEDVEDEEELEDDDEVEDEEELDDDEEVEDEEELDDDEEVEDEEELEDDEEVEDEEELEDDEDVEDEEELEDDEEVEDEEELEDDEEVEDEEELEDEEEVEDEEELEDDEDAEDEEELGDDGVVTLEHEAEEGADASGPDAEAPTYEIPRPDASPQPEPAAGNGQQGSLFGSVADDQELVDEAARTVIRAHRASVTMLQRRLRVDYEEARELIETLRKSGVIGGDAGDSHAPVLMELEEWETR